MWVAGGGSNPTCMKQNEWSQLNHETYTMRKVRYPWFCYYSLVKIKEIWTTVTLALPPVPIIRLTSFFEEFIKNFKFSMKWEELTVTNVKPLLHWSLKGCRLRHFGVWQWRRRRRSVRRHFAVQHLLVRCRVIVWNNQMIYSNNISIITVLLDIFIRLRTCTLC